MQKENQDIIIAIISGTLFVLLFGFISFLVVVSYVRHKRKLLQEKEAREIVYQKELLQAQLEMQEHTFRTIAQEIHDNVGQILGLVKLNVNLLALTLKDNEIVENLREQTNKAMAELRHLGNSYHADRLAEQGLIDALKQQLEQLQKTGMFSTTFYSEYDRLQIRKNSLIFLYRMLQEALNNIVKHAKADKIDLNISRRGDEVCITLKDNGLGFDMADSAFKPGIGLVSMQERAAMINAHMELSSKLGVGTTIQFSFKQKNV